MPPIKKARPVDEDFSVDKEQVYYECIEHLISQRRNVTVGNGKVEHAVYLIAAFLRHAEKIVRIFDRVLMVGSRELVSIPATQYSLPRRRGKEEFFEWIKQHLRIKSFFGERSDGQRQGYCEQSGSSRAERTSVFH